MNRFLHRASARLALAAFAISLLAGCSVNMGYTKLPKPMSGGYVGFSVSHYRAQEDCEEANCYKPSYINCSMPNTVFVQAPQQQVAGQPGAPYGTPAGAPVNGPKSYY
jgi:hypothetical protein